MKPIIYFELERSKKNLDGYMKEPLSSLISAGLN